jgi:glycosyltransferase involved in cell wall biosynthesis
MKGGGLQPAFFMSEKISILFYNPDQAGVGYYRTLMPALRLQKDYPEEFHVEINANVDWNNLDYLKRFHIIHGHRTLCDPSQMPALVGDLRKLGIKVVLDLDDYWEVHEEHPLLGLIKTQNLATKIKDTLRLADCVTTTTPRFADYIRPLNRNVVVIPNGVDADQQQFQYMPKPATDKVKLMWLGGSSHEGDINLLKDSFQRLQGEATLKNKFQLHLAGFDTRGTKSDVVMNQSFIKEMHEAKLVKPGIWKALETNGWNLDALPEIPQAIRDRYRHNVINYSTRDIKPEETVWARYEEVFTSDYKLVEDKAYKQWLLRYEIMTPYTGDLSAQPYVRHRTQGVNMFANNYRHADVCLAPLKAFGKIKNGAFADNASNRYQFAKSNLKAIEAGFHKVPLIASQVPTYADDQDFKDGKNIVFIKAERQEKDWFKKMKELIQNPNQVADLGEAAYELVTRKYSLEKVTRTRRDLYKSLVK